MCKTNKKEFDTIFDALIRVKEINPRKEPNKPNRAYKCEFCGKFHLTKGSHDALAKRNKKISEKVKRHEENFIKKETDFLIKKFKLYEPKTANNKQAKRKPRA